LKVLIDAFNYLATGNPHGHDLGKSMQALGGCVTDLLGEMLNVETME